jgi:phospholipid transport system substrate-binding protein
MGDNWQITDVLLNGTISQVAIHSSDFSALVTSGDATQLIAALKTKIAALASGPTSPAGQ